MRPSLLSGSPEVTGLGLLEVGRVEESLAVQQRVVALEPFVPRFRVNLATNLWLAGQDKDAIGILSNTLSDHDRSVGGFVRLAMIHAAEGRYDEAAKALESIPAGVFPKGAVEAAARLLRIAPSAGSLNGIPELGALGFVYLYAGEPSRMLEFYEVSIENGFVLGIAPLWHEAYAPLRQTERFKALLRKARLPEFWRARGWPKFCHPTSGEDFVCE
jgi:hypothetical protein